MYHNVLKATTGTDTLSRALNQATSIILLTIHSNITYSMKSNMTRIRHICTRLPQAKSCSGKTTLGFKHYIISKPYKPTFSRAHSLVESELQNCNTGISLATFFNQAQPHSVLLSQPHPHDKAKLYCKHIICDNCSSKSYTVALPRSMLYHY